MTAPRPINPRPGLRPWLTHTLAPILLRAVLGLVVLWTAFGKLAATEEVPAATGPVLASMDIAPIPIDADEPTQGLVIQRVYLTAIKVHQAANPPFDAASGLRREALWPAWAASGVKPKAVALTLMIGELIAGVLLVLGLGTRLAGVFVALASLCTLWLFSAVPAIHAGATVVGILPQHGAFDTSAWLPTAWPALLMCIALTIAIAGPGALSIDALLFKGAPRDEE